MQAIVRSALTDTELVFRFSHYKREKNAETDQNASDSHHRGQVQLIGDGLDLSPR
jgi:hypothetical protein